MRTYDHIVIGAGSAGCAVAARLSEDPDRTVLLIEAGGPARSMTQIVPAAYMDQFHGRADWAYMTEPEPGCDGRSIYEPRAKAIGGCSQMNAMVWIRGNPADYDGWGVEGWSWEDVRPVFESMEHRHAPAVGAGGDGPTHITRRAQGDDEICDAFIAAAAEATGVPTGGDLSGHDATTGYTQQTVWKGRRWTAAHSYLRPAAKRKNLTVLPRTLVRRIVIRDGRAVGVEFERFGRRGAAGSRGDVVLCAGAFNTPHLLQLSGIGDAEHLRSIGVDVEVDNPGVGAELNEHPLAFAVWELKTPGPLGLFDAKHPKHLLRWLAGGRGLLATSPVQALAHLPTDDAIADPDLQLLMFPGYAWYDSPGVVAEHPNPAMGMAMSYWTPASRGTVRAKSSDPREKPAVTLNLLTEREDLDAMVRCIAIARRIAATEPLASMLGVELHPGEWVTSREDVEAYLRASCEHTYHPSCTARMGEPGDGVVDARLRVHGVAGLRVADASAMPRVPRANTHAPTVMIGERCASFVREESRAGAGALATA